MPGKPYHKIKCTHSVGIVSNFLGAVHITGVLFKELGFNFIPSRCGLSTLRCNERGSTPV
jgi:hypothetical protein